MTRIWSVAVAVCAFSASAMAQPLVITNVEPSLLIVGDADTTLQVTGSGFTAPVLGPTASVGTLVKVDPPGDLPPVLFLPTTFVSPTELEAQLPGEGTRASVVRAAMLGQLTEQAITAYLNGTGGFLCSYQDVCPSGIGGGSTVSDSTGVEGWRYVEVAFRLGYSMNCPIIDDGVRRFCPNQPANLQGEPRVLTVSAVRGSFPNITTSTTLDLSIIQQPPATPGLRGVGLLALVIALAVVGWVSLRVNAAS